MNKQNEKLHALLMFIAILFISVTAFYAVSVPRNISDASAAGGVLNLTGADFSHTLFNLNGEWEFYFGELFTPEDFQNETPEEGTLINVPVSWSEAGYPLRGFATYRLKIITDEPELMILVPEIMDASKIWINGRLVFEAGTVGRTAEEIKTSVRNAFVTFAPQDGEAEIVLQAANDGRYLSGIVYSITAGRADVLLGDALLRRVLLGIVLGMFLVLGLYHAVLFVYSRRERVYLVFSLLCVIIAARFCLEQNGFAQLFLPGGMGEGLTKLYMILLILQIAGIVTFVHLTLGLPIGKVCRAVYAVCFFAPLTAVFILPYGMLAVQVGYVLTALIPGVTAFINAARSGRVRENPYNLLFLFAMGAFCLWGPVTVILLDDTMYMQGILTNIFLVLSQCAVLSVSYAEAKRRAMEADIRERTLADENAMMDSLNQMKSDFLANISHEMNTPLAVMSGYAQQTRDEIETGEVNEETAANLSVIQSEANRLSELAGQVLYAAKNLQVGITVSPVRSADILARAAMLCEPILTKNGNRLVTAAEPNCPAVAANQNIILQVLLNLCTNANRHAKNGTVSITARHTGDFVTFAAKDDGGGIPPKLLPHVFERGVSGDGKTGLGLALCNDVIRQYGGTIDIANKPDKGVCVSFTLPVAEMGESL